ncbi:hypothetical protein EVAR_69918_1 [Eumeta japonica]|uniref:Uncharacterized protein n=1 Tax=Eumeta variegata TaxID=151549 RepID=A0A4C1T407_EUMVA|nr:hypothetical protein EVAR_69918_1 [Eumeta japonica]
MDLTINFTVAKKVKYATEFQVKDDENKLGEGSDDEDGRSRSQPSKERHYKSREINTKTSPYYLFTSSPRLRQCSLEEAFICKDGILAQEENHIDAEYASHRRQSRTEARRERSTHSRSRWKQKKC